MKPFGRYIIKALLLGMSLTSCEQASPAAKPVVATVPFKKEAKMDKQEFWRLIDFSKQQAAGDNAAQEALLIKTLSHYAPADIITFEYLLRQQLEEADDFNIMAAAKIMEGSVTDDSYIYFRCWLISQGEKVFTEAIRNPDTLAQLETDDSTTDFEPLLYVTTAAYKVKTGQQKEDDSFPRAKAAERGLSYDFGSHTKGNDWTPEQLSTLLPKLWAKYD